MPLVEAVLAGEAPVAAARLDAAAHHEGVRHQFLGELLVDRVRLLVGDRNVHPDHAEPLLDGVRAHTQLARETAPGAVGDDRGELAGGQVEGPAVIRAADGAGELLVALGQRDAAVWAAIVQRVHLSVVADQRDLLAAECERFWITGDVARPGDRVPVAAEARRRRVVVGPGRPVLPADLVGGSPASLSGLFRGALLHCGGSFARRHLARGLLLRWMCATSIRRGAAPAYEPVPVNGPWPAADRSANRRP